MSHDSFRRQVYSGILRAYALRKDGEAAAALEVLEEVMALVASTSHAGIGLRRLCLSQKAHCHEDVGDHVSARDLLQEALHLCYPATEEGIMTLGIRRRLANALHALGDAGGAAATFGPEHARSLAILEFNSMAMLPAMFEDGPFRYSPVVDLDCDDDVEEIMN